MDNNTKTENLSAIADSQQNLVEVYTKRRYFQRWTNVEKIFGILIVLLFILFLTFFILYLVFQRCYYQIVNEAICTSKECMQSAMTLLQTVNFSQNPCDDFYNFACGRFGEEHPIEEGYNHNSWFLEKEIRLNRLVQKVLEEPEKSSDLKCVKGTKLFYQSCVNASELNQLGLNPLFELLELVELPKTVPTKEESEGFNLGRTLALSQRHLSQDILITVSLERVGDKNITVQNATLLRFSPGISGLSVFRRWKYEKDMFALGSEIHSSGIIENEFEWNDLKELSPRKIILATISFITDIFREILRELGQSDKYNSTELVATAYKIITFTAELDWKNKNNKTRGEDVGDEEEEEGEEGDKEEEEEEEDRYMTLPELQAILDEESNTDSLSQKVDWKEYVSVLFENVNVSYSTETDIVIVENMEYFKFLSRILGKAKPVTIQRHVWWKLVEEFGRYTTSTMRSIYGKYSLALYGEGIGSSRSETCTLTMRKFMNIALSHQMAKMDNFSSATVKVREILKDIEHVFGTVVKSTPWMDSTTKKMLLDKAESVKDEIGYPVWLFDEDTVNGFYNGLDLQKSEFLKNIIRINEWEVEKVLITIGPDKEVRNSTVTWFSNPLQFLKLSLSVQAAIPPGILQSPFYFRGLESLNYGAIGSILGHELTHGFDTEGKNYNKYGKKLANPWPEEVTLEYEKRAKCFVEQYGTYTLYKDKKLNGTVTLAENIADNGGMRESFNAYKLYKSRHGTELKLPGFENFTDEQLLFLSFANIWCEEALPKYHLLGEDSHSPHRIRVLATLKNMKEFAEAYNCPSGSNMNPRNKCIIW